MEAIQKEIEEISERKAAEEAAKQAERDALKKKTVNPQKIDIDPNVIASRVPNYARRPGVPRVFLVFQGMSFEDAFKKGILWAPEKSVKGINRSYYSRIHDIIEGDLVFNCSGGYIMAISVAKGSCKACRRPEGDVWKNWIDSGYSVDCEYFQLQNPVKHGKYKDKYAEYESDIAFPFNRDKNGKQGYLFAVPESLSAFLIQEIIKTNKYIENLDCIQHFITDVIAD